MEYSKEFIDLVKSSKDNEFIGFGNPKSKILIVGKEAATDWNYKTNAKDWLSNIENNKAIDDIDKNAIFDPSFATECPEFHKEGGCTWRKYQKLHDFIFEGSINPNPEREYNFLKNIFITEMGSIPSKRTKEAQQNPDFKKELDKRKTFFQSEYINQFPVIVLACGNYIGYYDNINQIEDTFGVTFDKKYPTTNSNAQSFWIHFNKDKPKLVIHTRQLSGSVSDELLEGIASHIKQFKEKNPHSFE
jgi:hypothetical protein